MIFTWTLDTVLGFFGLVLMLLTGVFLFGSFLWGALLKWMRDE